MSTSTMVRMEALQYHTLYGAGHEKPYAPGDTYAVEAEFVDLLVVQGKAKRIVIPTPLPPTRRTAPAEPRSGSGTAVAPMGVGALGGAGALGTAGVGPATPIAPATLVAPVEPSTKK